MAKRPIFISKNSSENLFERKMIDFKWFSGFAVIQKQRSIQSLHESALEKNENLKILEISSKSLQELGVQLSAFNLKILTKKGKEFSVETAFQASKVFKNGGPFLDLYEKTSKEAKKDKRLKESGPLTGFKYFNREFPLEPKTFFYNWLYINALSKQKHLSDEIQKYNAFTDIEFNPDKSINCQAEAAAIYVALCKNELLTLALESEEAFRKIVYNLPPEPKQDTKKIITEKTEQLNLL